MYCTRQDTRSCGGGRNEGEMTQIEQRESGQSDRSFYIVRHVERILTFTRSRCSIQGTTDIGVFFTCTSMHQSAQGFNSCPHRLSENRETVSLQGHHPFEHVLQRCSYIIALLHGPRWYCSFDLFLRHGFNTTTQKGRSMAGHACCGSSSLNFPTGLV